METKSPRMLTPELQARFDELVSRRGREIAARAKKKAHQELVPWNGFKSHMLMRKKQNMDRSLTNPNENWLAEKLSKTGLRWGRQIIYGRRIFDFWCFQKGIDLEVDGESHDPVKDIERDRMLMGTYGILVIRVRNRREEDAIKAVDDIALAEEWKTRRTRLGLKSTREAQFEMEALGVSDTETIIAHVSSRNANPMPSVDDDGIIAFQGFRSDVLLAMEPYVTQGYRIVPGSLKKRKAGMFVWVKLWPQDLLC